MHLALNGGRAVRTNPFPGYPLIGDEEVNAVSEVVRSGKLSMFDLDFLGGEKVRTFEENFASTPGSAMVYPSIQVPQRSILPLPHCKSGQEMKSSSLPIHSPRRHPAS